MSFKQSVTIKVAEPEKQRLLEDSQFHFLTEDVKLSKNNAIFIFQVLATFIFIYSSTCFKPETGLNLQFFASIVIAIPISGNHKGANLNPGISLSKYLRNGSDWTFSLFFLYFKAQVLAALTAIVLAYVVNDVYRPPVYMDDPSPLQAIRTMMSEATGVFILVSISLNASGPISFIDSPIAKYFFISLFVYIGRQFATISKCQINVAVTLSRALIGIIKCDFIGLKHFGIWFLGDTMGALLAITWYNKVAEPTVKQLRRRKKEKQQHEKHLIQMKQLH